MTSRLHKSRRTTRRNTRRWNRISVVVAALGLCAPVALAAEPGAATDDIPVWARTTETAERSPADARDSKSQWNSDWQQFSDGREKLPRSYVRPSKVRRAAKAEPAEQTIELTRHSQDTDSNEEAASTIEQAAGESSPGVEDASFTERRSLAEPAAITQPEPGVIEKSIVEEAIMERTAQVPPAPDGDDPAAELAAEPSYDLGKINDILPYADYEPDPQVSRDDPCLNQCPRPEGGCEPNAEGRGNTFCPSMVQLSDAPFEGRLFANSVYCWQASDVWHHPLYFEDPALERYGHTHCCLVQPFASAGRFSAQFLALPYQMSIDPMCSCRYPLGYYRPGECAPKLCYQPPLNFDAAAVTAGFYTGMVYLIP